jgi:hypothetical protein
LIAAGWAAPTRQNTFENIWFWLLHCIYDTDKILTCEQRSVASETKTGIESMTNEQLIQEAAKAGVTLKTIEAVYGVSLDGKTTMGHLVQADGLVWQLVGGKCNKYTSFVDAGLAAKNMANPATLAKFPAFAVTFIR